MSDLQRNVSSDVLGRLDSSHRTACSSEREHLRAIVDCDRAGLWEDDGSKTFSAWLATRYGISQWKARRFIEAAYALESLPRLAAALATGALSLDKTVELARFATPHDEEELVAWANRVSPGAIRRRADSLERASDAAEPRRNRRLRMWWQGAESLAFEGRLPLAEGAAFKAAIDRLADDLPDNPDEDDGDQEVSIERRRADALCLMASAQIADDADPDRATVVVYASLAELDADRYGCELEGGARLHPETARRLACDCRHQVVATGENGDVGVGHSARIVPRWLRRLVMKRDKGCAFTGCEMKRFLECHHIIHWIKGGETTLSNLVMLCSAHHTLVHEYGWNVVLEDDGALFFRPDGRVFNPGIAIDRSAIDAVAELERARARGPSPGLIEERFGLQNFRLKEISSGFADDLMETARALIG